MMLDWNDYRKKVLARIGEMGKLSPDTLRGYQELSNARAKTGALDAKTRARSQALADFWRGMATIDGKAQALGSFAVLQGGYEKLFSEPRALEAVTVQDIQKIATELLRTTNRTVGVLASPAATGEKE